MEQELAQLAETFKEHADQDSVNFAAIHIKMDGLATKEDIEQVLEFMKKINTGEKIIKWSWNNLAKIGTVGLALIFIWGVFKFGLIGAFHYVARLTSGN